MRFHLWQHLLALEQDPDRCAEFMQVRDIRFLSIPSLIWGCFPHSRAICTVTDICCMCNCLFLKEDRKISSKVHSSCKILQSPIHPFYNSILWGRMWSSHMGFHAFWIQPFKKRVVNELVSSVNAHGFGRFALGFKVCEIVFYLLSHLIFWF